MPVGAVAAGSPAAGVCVGFRRGRQRPLISAKSNHRPIGGLVSVCDNVDVATLRYSTATELRAWSSRTAQRTVTAALAAGIRG